RRRPEAALASGQDAVRRALVGEVFPDLADVVVHPPDVGVVLPLGAEVRFAERRHGGGARATPAHRTQLEETAELRAIRAEEIVVDDVWGAQWSVRNARRVPDEEA